MPIKLPAISVTVVEKNNNIRVLNDRTPKDGKMAGLGVPKINTRAKGMSKSFENLDSRNVLFGPRKGETANKNDRGFDSLRRSSSSNDLFRAGEGSSGKRNGAKRADTPMVDIDRRHRSPGRNMELNRPIANRTISSERLLSRRQHNSSNTSLCDENGDDVNSLMSGRRCSSSNDVTKYRDTDECETLDKANGRIARSRDSIFDEVFQNLLRESRMTSLDEREDKGSPWEVEKDKNVSCEEQEERKRSPSTTNVDKEPVITPALKGCPDVGIHSGSPTVNVTSSARAHNKRILPTLKIGNNYRVDTRDFCFRCANPKALIEEAVAKRRGSNTKSMNLRKNTSREEGVQRTKSEEENEAMLEDPLSVAVPASTAFKEVLYEKCDYCVLSPGSADRAETPLFPGEAHGYLQ